MLTVLILYFLFCFIFSIFYNVFLPIFLSFFYVQYFFNALFLFLFRFGFNSFHIYVLCFFSVFLLWFDQYLYSICFFILFVLLFLSFFFIYKYYINSFHDIFKYLDFCKVDISFLSDIKNDFVVYNKEITKIDSLRVVLFINSIYYLVSYKSVEMHVNFDKISHFMYLLSKFLIYNERYSYILFIYKNFAFNIFFLYLFVILYIVNI